MSESARQAMRQVIAYFVIAGALATIGTPSWGGASTAFAFLLKDSLKLEATDVAFASLLVSVPLYVSFVFGFVRDRWSPLGLGDRGYFIVFGLLGALPYAWMSFGHVGYAKLLVGFSIATVAYGFVVAAIGGITTTVGQAHRVTGRLSALNQSLHFTLVSASFAVGGLVHGEARSQRLFAALAAITLGFVALGTWRPRAVFPPTAAVPAGPAPHPFREIGRLLRHRPLWPALLVWLLFQFAPVGTPLVFFVSRDLHGTQDQFGWIAALSTVSAIPGSLAYGWLCKRRSLQSVLGWTTLIATFNFVPFLFVHDPTQAMLVAPIMGIISGWAQTVYWDLLLRSFPKGLEGTASTLTNTTFFVAVRLADLLGAWLYDHGGFAWTVIDTAAGTAAILLVLPLVPRKVVEQADVVSLEGVGAGVEGGGE